MVPHLPKQETTCRGIPGGSKHSGRESTALRESLRSGSSFRSLAGKSVIRLRNVRCIADRKYHAHIAAGQQEWSIPGTGDADHVERPAFDDVGLQMVRRQTGCCQANAGGVGGFKRALADSATAFRGHRVDE